MAEANNTAMISCSAISVFASLIPLSLFAFHYKKALKTRYLQLVLLIQLSDMLTSLGGVFGLQRQHTFGCYFQWFMTNYFPLYSCFLCMIITRELYHVFSLGKGVTDKTYKYSHVLAFVAPLVLTLLPLSSERVGSASDDEDDEVGWCFIIPGDSAPAWVFTFWILACFYAWLWMSILYMLVLIVLMIINIGNMTSQSLKEHCMKSLKKLCCYPVMIILGWICGAYYDTTYALDPNSDIESWGHYGFLLYGLPFLIGFATTVIFLLTNKDLVKLWSLEIFMYLGLLSPQSKWVIGKNSQNFDYTALPRDSPADLNRESSRETGSVALSEVGTTSPNVNMNVDADWGEGNKGTTTVDGNGGKNPILGAIS